MSTKRIGARSWDSNIAGPLGHKPIGLKPGSRTATSPVKRKFAILARHHKTIRIGRISRKIMTTVVGIIPPGKPVLGSRSLDFSTQPLARNNLLGYSALNVHTEVAITSRLLVINIDR